MCIYIYIHVYPGPFIHPAQIVQRKILSLLSYWLSIVILSQVLVQQTVPSWLCRLLVFWGCRLPCLFWSHQGYAMFICYLMLSWWLSNSCAGQMAYPTLEYRNPRRSTAGNILKNCGSLEFQVFSPFDMPPQSELVRFWMTNRKPTVFNHTTFRGPVSPWDWTRHLS